MSQRPTGPGDVLLEVANLGVSFDRRGDAPFRPVEDVSFTIARGERVGLVGESGSGKSLTALALLSLIDRVGGAIDERSVVRFEDQDLTRLSERQLRAMRGGRIGMIFQDPMTSLNPVHRVDRHLLDVIDLHRPELSREEGRRHALELLDQVQLPRPDRVMRAYPHELSGGMRQRVMIAVALASAPSLLIADEPTTALDVTVQAEILDLLHRICEDRGLAVLLITHDLGIVAGFTDRVLVMYGGRVVEASPTDELFSRPLHPYPAALLESIPSVSAAHHRLQAIPGAPPDPAARPPGCSFHDRCAHVDLARCASAVPELRAPNGTTGRAAACVRMEELDLRRAPAPPATPAASNGAEARPAAAPLLEVSDLTKVYRVRGDAGSEVITALDGVSLSLAPGEALGIVGESGSGKSTLARCILRLTEPTSGSVRFGDVEVLRARQRRLRGLRRHMQLVFQDPSASLDPRMRIEDILAEPLRVHGLWGKPGNDGERLREVLDLVQLPSSALRRYPHQFSGGQRQRIAIARALVLSPELLVCDEPVSALDVSVQASILNLLADIGEELGIALIFITHDLALVRFLCDRVGVMYRGELVELRPTEAVFAGPNHDHTRQLLTAHPVPEPSVAREQRRARAALRAGPTELLRN